MAGLNRCPNCGADHSKCKNCNLPVEKEQVYEPEDWLIKQLNQPIKRRKLKVVER